MIRHYNHLHQADNRAHKTGPERIYFELLSIETAVSFHMLIIGDEEATVRGVWE